MTPTDAIARLRELRELREKATGGTWEADASLVYTKARTIASLRFGDRVRDEDESARVVMHAHSEIEAQHADAAAIVAAINALPALLECAEALASLIDRIDNKMSVFDGDVLMKVGVHACIDSSKARDALDALATMRRVSAGEEVGT